MFFTIAIQFFTVPYSVAAARFGKLFHITDSLCLGFAVS
jgi:hypothetical protein